MNLINYVLLFITIAKLEPDFGQLEFTDFTEKHIVFDRQIQVCSCFLASDSYSIQAEDFKHV